MAGFYHHPFAIFIVALVVQWLGARLGHALRQRGRAAVDTERADFSAILGATLTLQALIIGFSFLMAVTRYDARKDLEASEANAIGTEYVRADLLPPTAAASVRDLLVRYTGQRILFHRESDPARLDRIDAETARLQRQMWSAVAGPAEAAPTPVAALVVSGMNDVLNAQGYTGAAWRNHIPIGAWGLMLLMAFASNVLLGAVEHRKGTRILAILPVIVSVPFLLIADIDSPRAGIIRVQPVNLVAFVRSLPPPSSPKSEPSPAPGQESAG
ncbi:hypothetical protein [Caulobacter sp. 17J65-9]|uniref:bestrophin-like domain n=1 Tax=Caulobacter sp. 17J65-9 TaxID=2709382 RepID=UPI0013CB47EE|nr:hypothetical protein [Caulobacter sp. 17J65-9]NEX93644.1 hypothetical protein [Caulobacter sp. 17J65-9]